MGTRVFRLSLLLMSRSSRKCQLLAFLLKLFVSCTLVLQPQFCRRADISAKLLQKQPFSSTWNFFESRWLKSLQYPMMVYDVYGLQRIATASFSYQFFSGAEV